MIAAGQYASGFTRKELRPRPARLEYPLAAFPTAIAVAIVHRLFRLFMYGKFRLHDTRYNFETFCALYNSLLNYRQAPLWMPHIQYRAPPDYSLLAHISAAQLFFAQAGMLFPPITFWGCFTLPCRFNWSYSCLCSENTGWTGLDSGGRRRQCSWWQL